MQRCHAARPVVDVEPVEKEKRAELPLSNLQMSRFEPALDGRIDTPLSRPAAGPEAIYRACSGFAELRFEN